jgi:arsenate reductase
MKVFHSMPSASAKLYPELASYVAKRQAEFEEIPAPRRDDLRRVANYLQERIHAGQTARLIFICTHNSRRSHFSQIWAQVAADLHGLVGVETYSGGTEATAFNPRAVASLRRAGFQIDTNHAADENPLYHVRHAENAPAQKCFSKVFDQAPNPTTEYCAVMTCSQADDACPLVMGCDVRAPIRYEDPKMADDTPKEQAVYDERSRQICREMLFMMSLV